MYPEIIQKFSLLLPLFCCYYYFTLFCTYLLDMSRVTLMMYVPQSHVKVYIVIFLLVCKLVVYVMYITGPPSNNLHLFFFCLLYYYISNTNSNHVFIIIFTLLLFTVYIIFSINSFLILFNV